MRALVLILVAAVPAVSAVIPDVRAAIAEDDFARGEQLIAEYRSSEGVTPEMLEAVSWLGRGALQAGRLDEANRYAAETRGLSIEMLESRELDAERRLPIALGASIEVQAHVMAERGALSEAIVFLEGELDRWADTSIVTRIQKNVNLLSLEGKPAPALEADYHLGAYATSLGELKGNVVLLFFWAHWCGDCKAQAPIVARLQEEYAGQGFRVVGPTQLYGYRSRGEDATPAEELEWIEQVKAEYYSGISDMPVPVSAKTFTRYGCSTTPTLVLVDREGIVRLYHPGGRPYEELATLVEELLDA